jgi:hypothetical protein
MALFEDLFKGNAAVVIGVGAVALLAPTVLPPLVRVLRPLAKEAIKGAITLYDQARETVGEVTGDLVAEARAELDEQSSRRGGAVALASAGDKPGDTTGARTGEATAT